MVESTANLDKLLAEEEPQKSHSGCASCGTGQLLAQLTRCGNGLEKIYGTTAVRFGFLRYIGEFTHAQDMKFTCGAKVVIQTQRGIEIGEQVSLTCGGCEKSVTRDQMRAWVDTCGEDTYLFNAGRILREATAGDLSEYARMQASALEKRNFARRIAERQNVPLKVVECECLFGGERIIFFFTAAERVDFRTMVRDLAAEYRTRIEMRQIGARDEARLLADYETCGREVCCKVFLKTLKPISMRMAKLQKATLDPTQVSGRCGRLKCCLRYEHTTYEELDKMLPRVGVRIRTNHGEGVVVNRQILTQLVQIRADDDNLITVVAEDVTAVNVPAPVETAAGPSPSDQAAAEYRGRPRPAPRREPSPARPSETQAAEPSDADEEVTDVTGANTGPLAEPLEGPGTASEPGGPLRRRGRRRRPRRGGGPSRGAETPPSPP